VSASTVERSADTDAVELPTLLLVLVAYGGWLTITWGYGRWPLWIVAPIGMLLVTLHGSLQHEIVHGHPTSWRAINRLLAIVPLNLWLPYARYRKNHLQHHRDDRLTDPLEDPESYYWTAEDLGRQNPVMRALLRVQQTLAGRIVVGSVWSIGRFYWHEGRALRRGERRVAVVWLEHILWCVPVLIWVNVFCGMPVWIYLTAIVLPANGITLIRSFAEHRARPGVRERIAIVEGAWFLGPLFLFNNLHSLHHEAPHIPWYRYNARYRQMRARLLAENGGLVYVTYFAVARRYLFRPHDALKHPLGRVPLN
jgi:fatty acid desaturase